AAKRLESLRNYSFRNFIIRRQRRRCRGIPDVVFAAEREFEVRPRFSIAQHRPGSSFRVQLQICDFPVRASGRAVTFDGAEGFLQAAVDTLDWALARALRRIKGDNPPAS